MEVKNNRVEEVATLHYEDPHSLNEDVLEKILTTHVIPAMSETQEAGIQRLDPRFSLNTRGGDDKEGKKVRGGEDQEGVVIPATSKPLEAGIQHASPPSANSSQSFQRAWKPETFHPKIVINCTGAWLPITSKLYNHPSPVQPVRRQISVFSSHKEDLSEHGMMVDTSGLYLHPEGSHTGLFLAGYSNRDEKPGYRFDYDGEPFFDKQIWQRLYRRGNRNHFDEIKHVRGWSGLYEVSPDRTGILWKVEDLENLYELGAATGRGVMQSYALGRGLAELVLGGKFETIDLSPLSAKRFQTGELLWERLDI